MKYEVRCECGKSLAVTGADAGVSLRCGCGRTVEVPPLHELRTAVGEAVLSPAIRIRTLLMEGKLPGTRNCAWCHRETDGAIRVSVQCEQVILKSRMGNADTLAGCFLFGLIPTLMLRSAAKTVEHGENITFTLPLPVCESCRPLSSTPRELPKALRSISDYAALLDAHPDAKIVLLV
jgi:hypothetical protein